MLPPYAELHCLSNFSFLRGASHPEELVERAQAAGYAALALTDECSLAGAVRAHLAAKDAGLPLVLGSEFSLADGLKLVLYATNRDTYGDLAQLVTRGRRNAKKGTYRLARDDVAEVAPRCLALWLPITPSPRARDDGSDTEAGNARWFADVFPGRAWIAAELFARSGDRARLAALQALSRTSGLPLVAAGDVHMHVRARRALQDTLTAIRLGTPLAECGYALFPNGERHLRSRARLATLYPRELTDATLDLVARCTFSLDELRYEYPEEIVPAGATADSHLRALVEQGLVRRYGPGGAPPEVRKLIEHELTLIAELRYEAYFLTVEDIVSFARSKEILCQGRGSAANSAVCYALGITEVDPSRMSMLFERFISKERNEPPDIDVDFEHHETGNTDERLMIHLVRLDQESTVTHDRFVVQPDVEVAAHAIDVRRRVPRLAGVLVVRMPERDVNAGDFLVLQNVADDARDSQIRADGELAHPIAVLVCARIRRKFIQQFFVRTLHVDDARLFDFNRQWRLLQIAVLGAEIIAHDTVAYKHAVDRERRREDLAAGEVAPLIGRDEAAGLDPFQIGRHLRHDVRAALRSRPHEFGLPRLFDHAFAQPIDFQKVGPHALQHDVFGDVDHVPVAQPLPVDDVHHLHARPQFAALGLRRKNTDL